MERRPLCIASIIYIIGILIGLYFRLSIAFLLILIIVLALYIIIRRNGITEKIRMIKMILMTIGILIFSIVYVIYIDTSYENMYKKIRQLDEISIRGIVLTSPKEEQYYTKYEIKLLEINGDRIYQGKRIILNIKKKEERKILQYGDYINIQGEFMIPSEARNYGGFDYKQYLKTKKIYGTVNCSEVQVIKKDCSSMFGKIIYQIQNSVKNNMKKLLSDKTADLCVGILIGDRENLEEKIEDDFKNSNLTHMLAVSGTHISYIILGLTIITQKISKRFTKIVIIIFLIFFTGLANFTPSVVRASIMGIVMLSANLFYRKSDIFNNLAISTIIILIINPYAILDIGFQLSYTGTIGIVLLNDKIHKVVDYKINVKNKILRYIIDSIIVTLSANIFIIPIMAYQFNSISFTFWISNLLASPLMGISVILGFLIYLISLISTLIAKVIAVPLDIILLLFLKIAEICAKLPLSSIIVKTPYIISIVMYYMFLLMILNRNMLECWIKEYWIIKIKRELNKKKTKLHLIWKKQTFLLYTIISISIIVLIISNTIIINNRQLTIYFIDVGQGDCSLIITPRNKSILIDGGGSEIGNFDVGEKILLPYLLDRRISSLDYVIISHFDTDHVGGLLTVMEKLNVDTAVISKQGESSQNYERFKEIVKEKHIKVLVVGQGDTIKIEKNLYFDILWPNNSKLISENVLNNNSIVCKLYYKNISMLFTGDIEEIAEEQILKEHNLNSTILKVAHHGSKTSSKQEFIENIKPKIALIGVGEDNKFGHPNDGVLSRLEKLRSKNLSNRSNGRNNYKYK